MLKSACMAALSTGFILGSLSLLALLLSLTILWGSRYFAIRHVSPHIQKMDPLTRQRLRFFMGYAWHPFNRVYLLGLVGVLATAAFLAQSTGRPDRSTEWMSWMGIWLAAAAYLLPAVLTLGILVVRKRRAETSRMKRFVPTLEANYSDDSEWPLVKRKSVPRESR